MFRSEATAKSLVRYSDRSEVDESDITPLVELEAFKNYYGVVGSDNDTKIENSLEVVSALIRNYCERYITSCDVIETFTDVTSLSPERYLVEIPVTEIIESSDYSLLNRRTGRVVMTGGPEIAVEYTGGYTKLPADLEAVVMELTRQQLATLGVTDIGIPIDNPPERAVWVGTLKVEYATSATSTNVKASGGGAITADALAPYTAILDTYAARRRWVAT